MSDSGFCRVTPSVCRLEAVEIGRILDLRHNARKDEFLQQFRDGVECLRLGGSWPGFPDPSPSSLDIGVTHAVL